LTFRRKSAKMATVYSEEAEEYPAVCRKENPWTVKRGGRTSENTPQSRHPKGFGPVGVLRGRPLSRGRVMARREASVCEGGANQRWYRVS